VEQIDIAIGVRSIAFDQGVGGMERAAALHVTQMVDAGLDVSLYTPASFLKGSPPDGVTVVDVPWPRWGEGSGKVLFGPAYVAWARSLGAAFDGAAVPPQILHLHGGAAGALRHVRAWRFTAVTNPHGMEEFERASLLRTPNRMVSRRLSRGARSASAIIATDAGLVDVVERNFAVGAERVVLIPNAVDTTALRALAAPGEADDRFTIVSIGRLVPNKGYDLLCAALRQLEAQKRLPEGWRWIHFGSGAMEQELRSEAGRHPVIPLEIRADRPDAEVQQTLAGADLFVQPSRYEGSSLTTLEAMTHGVVVVATPVGGIPDKVVDGVTGYLATSVTAEGLRDALVAALAGGVDVGGNARRLVDERFSSEATTGRYLDLYIRLLRAPRG
jgi:glycosyltransferase involved in cell wall biosynthesis